MKIKKNVQSGRIFFSKLGISPVIMTVLFILVVVVGVVSYNIWFEDYSSNMRVNAEKQDITIPGIENILGKKAYLKNNFDENFVVDKIEIDGIVCSRDDNLNPGLNEVEVSVCTSTLQTGEHEIVMFSKYGVFSKYFYFKSQGFDMIFGNELILGDFKHEVVKNEDSSSKNTLINHDRGCQELQKMEDNLAGNYYLVEDIYCENTTFWNDGKGFIPIGDDGSFIGSLDGRGYSIYDLYVNDDEKETGLFSNLDGAKISNLNVIVNLITGSEKNLGGLAGVVDNSQIINVHVEGNVTGNKKEVGGLIGSAQNTIISKSSYKNGVVIGDRKSVGGLVGVCDNCQIYNSYSRGDVVGNKDYVAGFVGMIKDSIIVNSYSTGNVLANQGKGGFIGDNSNSLINYSFWDIENSGQIISAGGVGKSSLDMKKNQSTFTNWDFENVWIIQEGVDYPQLR